MVGSVKLRLQLQHLKIKAQRYRDERDKLDASLAFERSTVLILRDENEKLTIKLNAEHIVRQNVEVENAKLRELVRRYVEYTSQDRCEGCVVKSRCNDGDVEECWQLTEIRGLARELGIEVVE
jgi:hypothetical protein